MVDATGETVVLDQAGRVLLPETIREAAHVTARTEFSVRVAPDGSIVLRPLRDPEQAWFWSEGWQEGEREAGAQIAAHEGTVYENGEAFIRALRERRKDGADADLRG